MRKNYRKKQRTVTAYVFVAFAVFILILFGVDALLFGTQSATLKPVEVNTRIPTATAEPLPATLAEIEADCSKGECVEACLAHVNHLLQQQQFDLPEYAAEDADLVYYSISKTDELEKPRNFKVTGDLLSLRRNTDAHKIIWSYFQSLFPSELRPNLVTFGIYASATSDGKFDTTLTENWIMKINILALEDAYYLSSASVHEYGHYLTLNVTQRDQERDKWGYCKQEPLYDCPAPDSYLNLFYLEFWEDIYQEWADLDPYAANYESIARKFYEKYKDRFINDYAATDPIEDIAESWTAFMLEPLPSGNTVAEQKVRFFTAFPELVQLRYQVLKGICTFNGIPQDQ